MYFIKDGQPLYEYAPWNCNKNEFEKWENEIMIKHDKLTWMQNIYWYLDQVSCILVLRNKYWFSIAQPVLHSIWNTIEKERISGYTHRAPNKKIKDTKQLTVKNTQCYIDINSLLSDNNEITKNNTIISKEPENISESTKIISKKPENKSESTKIIHIDTEILKKI